MSLKQLDPQSVKRYAQMASIFYFFLQTSDIH